MMKIFFFIRNFSYGEDAYVLRGQRFRLPRIRLEIFKKTYFPSVISLWNTLDISSKSKPTLSTFKRSLKAKIIRKEILYYGRRWPSIHHARMRLGCSILKSHIFNNLHVVNEQWCACGYFSETVTHFLLSCLLYDTQHVEMIRTVIIDAVHRFIVQTERFRM